MMKSPDSHFFQKPLIVGENTLNEEESLHALRVCRAKDGDILRLCDGEGHFASGVITKADARGCQVLVKEIEKSTLQKPYLSIALAHLKDDGNEEVVFHASQMLVDEIIFLRTDHSQEPKNSDCKKTLRRAELKSKVGLKQSMKPWLTNIKGPISLDDWLLAYTGNLVLADINGSPSIPSLGVNSKTTLLIGPEGGFSTREIELIKGYSKGHVYLLSLGPTRLRARTAAIVALGKCLQ